MNNRVSTFRRSAMIICLLIIASVLFLVAPSAMAEPADDRVSVTITSFFRRNVSADGQIRCSELMEAIVTGYDGNPNDLTYEWTNVSCNADLYLYNSYNMSDIDDTPGEIEKLGQRESDGGRGFAWAAVRSKEARNYQGQIQVIVKDARGREIARDTYTNFADPSLSSDLAVIGFGLFEGEEVEIKTLLGRSVIVHITCSGASVNVDSMTNTEVAQITGSGSSRNPYKIKAIKMGDTAANVSISKTMCSFHTGQSASAKVPIYVFRKPTTSTTATTLTLAADSLDDRCDYFIGSVEGTKLDNGDIVFYDLTPNTTYQVTVRGEFTQTDGTTQYAYAYVSDTTKPVYSATVQTYLNDVSMDMSEILNSDVELYLHETGNANAEFIPLTRTGTGTYTASVNNGEYQVYSKKAGETEYKPAASYYLVITNKNGSVALKYYTVAYNSGDGSFAQGENPGKQVYLLGSKVSVTEAVPHRPGYSFDGWEYAGKAYNPGDTVTNSISSAIELVACWEKNVNITVNVTIDHNFEGGYDLVENRDEVDVSLLKKDTEDSSFLETGDDLHFDANGVTLNASQTLSYTIDSSEKSHKYTASGATFADMPDVYAYDVTVQKSGYDASVKTHKKSNGDWVIDITLSFRPTNFDLEFSVKMADDIPQELWPDAVIYRIAFWTGKEWKVITQMEEDQHGGKRVDIDPSTGEGSGDYPVWKYESDKTTPYYYRVWPTAFVYNEDKITSSTRGTNGETVYYTDGNYTATLGPVSAGVQVSDGLKGAYYDKNTDSQIGILDSVITLEAYDVIFNAMGGTVKGESAYTASNQYFIPALADYTPTNGKHNFLGWYMDEAYTEPAVEKQLLTDDAYLFARWDRTLTGTIEVEGSYKLDGETIEINARDLPTKATVILQEIAGNNAVNVNRIEIPINWNADTTLATIGYEFTGLSPDDDYRVVFVVPNYTAGYRNAQSSGSKYNENDYTAVYADGAITTFVNGRMTFKPDSYDQPVVVDATEIGEGFRPDDVLVEVHYKEVGVDEAFQVITQHTIDPYGIEVEMAANGLPNRTYSESVWRYEPNGNEFDYQAKVSKIGGLNADTLPVTIVYGAPARWSPLNSAPTGTLTAKIVPNQYVIRYHLGAETGNQTQDDSNGHTWSFDTPITYTPELPGYKFDGWYMDANLTGSPVTKIEAEYYPAGDDEVIHLYAKWTPRRDLSLTVYYKEAGTGTEIKEPTVSSNYTLGASVDINALAVQIPGYEYQNSDPASLMIAPTGNVVTLYYTKANVKYTVEIYYDEVFKTSQQYQAPFKSTVAPTINRVSDGYALDRVENLPLTISANPEENVIKVYYAKDDLHDGDITTPQDDDKETGGDGIPDKYQAIVTYEIENGKWADNSAAPIKEIFTLKTRNDAGEWTNTNVTLGNTIPTGMTPATGFDAASGKWTPVPDANAAIQGHASYRYAYGDKVHVALNITVVNGTSDPSATSGTHFYEYGDRKVNVTFTPDAEHILESATINGANAFDEISDGKYTYDCTENVEIVVHYTKDTVGGGDDGEDPDNIPDKYQKKIVFKVVNGTWKDGSTANIIKYVNLKTNGQWDVNGTASIADIVPTGMKPNEGYAVEPSRLWNPAIPETVSGTGESVFTFTFYPIILDLDPIVSYYQVVHMFEQPDGTYQEMQREFPLVGEIGTTVTATPITSYTNYELSTTHHAGGAGLSGTVTMPEDPEEGATQPKILTLTVYYNLKRYTVEYDLNGGTGAPGVDYSAKVYTHGSNEQFKAAASLYGYIFKGWKEEGTDQLHAAGTTFTIDRNIKLTAVWEKQSGLSYAVNFLDVESGRSIAAQKIAGGKTYGDTVNSADELITIPGYCFVGANPTTLTIDTHTEQNVINLYYAVDVLDDENDDETGDNIPDFYQKKITFKVVNGVWADDTSDAIVQIVTLRDQNNGLDATNGTAEISIPTGMKPTPDFTEQGCSWDTEPKSPIKMSDPDTYTFTFRGATPIQPYGASYIVLHFKADENNIYPSEATEKEVLGGPVNTEVSATPKTYEGYTLNTLLSNTSGTIKPVASLEDLLILKLYYDKDVLCDGDETDDPTDTDNETTGDGIPDIYQKKVTYSIVNGVWSDNTAGDIVEIVTLKNADGVCDINGVAALQSIPQGMQPMPNCTGGEWDVTPPQFVSGTNAETFVYWYTLNVIIPPTGDSARPMMWLCLMGASCLMMAVIAVQRKRNMKKH